jgi:hypothetical protein
MMMRGRRRKCGVKAEKNYIYICKQRGMLSNEHFMNPPPTPTALSLLYKSLYLTVK